MNPRPIFVLSLPRSGSTLLQRLLASHPDVATMSEPHVLLPLLFARRQGDVMAIYEHRKSVMAIDDVVQELGEAAWRDALQAFVTALYGAAADGASHFVDKTPRYLLAWRDLTAAFPDAHVVLLLRHPLACAASMLRTWGEGRFRLQEHVVDLHDGVRELAAARRALDGDRISVVDYDELATRPTRVLQRLHAEIGLEPAWPGQLELPALPGRMGDPGRDDHVGVRPSQPDAWVEAFRGPVRRRWAHRYLDSVGDDVLEAVGVDTQHSRRLLDDSPPSDAVRVALDGVDVARSAVARRLQTRAARERWGRRGRAAVLVS